MRDRRVIREDRKRLGELARLSDDEGRLRACREVAEGGGCARPEASDPRAELPVEAIGREAARFDVRERAERGLDEFRGGKRLVHVVAEGHR